jgi:hypothetical protein
MKTMKIEMKQTFDDTTEGSIIDKEGEEIYLSCIERHDETSYFQIGDGEKAFYLKRDQARALAGALLRFSDPFEEVSIDEDGSKKSLVELTKNLISLFDEAENTNCPTEVGMMIEQTVENMRIAVLREKIND